MMKVLNQKGETITEYDLSKGRLVTRKVVRADAPPVDNAQKFAWTEADLEEVQVYVPHRVKSAKEKIRELRSALSATDYQVIKCIECLILGKGFPYDMEKLYTERQAIRDRIHLLEQER